MKETLLEQQPSIRPPLDPSFRPAALGNRAFRKAVQESGQGVPVAFALEREGGRVSVYETALFPAGHALAELNVPYCERILKFLLWQKGGFKVSIAGADEVAA